MFEIEYVHLIRQLLNTSDFTAVISNNNINNYVQHYKNVLHYGIYLLNLEGFISYELHILIKIVIFYI